MDDATGLILSEKTLSTAVWIDRLSGLSGTIIQFPDVNLVM